MDKTQLSMRGDMDEYKTRETAFRNFSSKMPVSKSVAALLDQIGVGQQYVEFLNEAKGVFASIANDAPAFDGKKMHPVKGATATTSSYDFSYFNNSNAEKALTRYFFALIERMKEETNKQSEDGTNKVPKLPYENRDGQDIILPGSGVKPDGYFMFEDSIVDNISSVHILMEAKQYSIGIFSEADLGQMLDYVWAIWDNQPTRLFVPVALLHGVNADLLIFTRNDWYRCPLGQICHKTSSDQDIVLDDNIERTLISLWFMLTLPTERFGHFCERKDSYLGYLRFTHHDSEEVDADVEVYDMNNGPECMKVSESDPTRHVPLRGRMAYLYRSKYRNKPAILKLSWTPINRLPEGAVYDALKRSKVDGIPEVYDSGIIKENVFGYRVEYLILEHCGKTIDEHLRGLADKADVCAQTQRYMSQIASCLVEASEHGILHRDVSIGNIAIKNGQAKLIDWDLGKLLDSCLNKYPDLAKKWKFDKDSAESNENIYDYLVGTSLFIGIRILFEANTRSVVDDIESLFYVALYCLNKCQRINKAPEAFVFVDSETLGSTRISWLADKDRYLVGFGVNSEDITNGLQDHLAALHKVLFTDDGQFIGVKLRVDPGFERGFGIESVPGLFSKKVKDMINQKQHQDQGSVVDESIQMPMSQENEMDSMGGRNEVLDNHLREAGESVQPPTNSDVILQQAEPTFTLEQLQRAFAEVNLDRDTINHILNRLLQGPNEPAVPSPISPIEPAHPQFSHQIRPLPHRQGNRPQVPVPPAPFGCKAKPLPSKIPKLPSVSRRPVTRSSGVKRKESMDRTPSSSNKSNKRSRD